jgi:tRNA(Ile)-lysidine synthase
VVGYSGGQDSTCLLHALHERRLELLAVHVDHGLRPESAADAARVAENAATMGVACRVVRVQVQTSGGGVQAAARAARYQVLAEVVAEEQARALLMAHTADDQVETVLLNLVRGTGLAGLTGMRLEERWGNLRLARPLLRVERTITLAYCQELGLSVVEDASNQSRLYTRNRVRLDLLPALEAFNPSIRPVLARLADLAAEDEAALDAITEALFTDGRLARHGEAGTIEVDLAAWAPQPRALRRRLLRRALAALRGDLVDVPAAPIEDALDLLQSGQGGLSYHLPGGIELTTGSQSFVLRLHGRALAPKRTKSWGIGPPRV